MITIGGPIDIGRLLDELAATTGIDGLVVAAEGGKAGDDVDTTYSVDGISPDVLADALARAKPADRGRSLLLDSAEALEAVAAGIRAWSDVPDADRVLSAALLLCIDLLESPTVLRQIDAGRSSYTAAERRERKSVRQPRAGRSAVVPPGG